MLRHREDPPHLIVMAFETRLAANEAATAAQGLIEAGKLELGAAVFVQKDRDGGLSVEDAALGADEVGSPAFGALMSRLVAGASAPGGEASEVDLAGKLVDLGVAERSIEEIRCLVDPGDTGLALLATRLDEDEAAMTELRHFAGARLVVSTLADRWRDQVVADV